MYVQGFKFSRFQGLSKIVLNEVIILRIDQLERLIEIRKHESINSASSILHLTPQALCMSIKNLEDELEFQILERSAIGSTLTPQGNALVDATITFTNVIKTIRFNSQKEKYLPSEFILYMPYGFFEGIPSLHTALYKLYPNCRIILRGEYSNHSIISKVLSGEVEFALVRKFSLEGKDMLSDITPEVKFTPLFNSRYYCCGSRVFPILRYKSISLKTMTKCPLIIFEPTKEMELKVFEHICPQEHLKIIWVYNELAYNELIKSGHGIGFSLLKQSNNTITPCTMSFAQNLSETVIVPIKENIILSLGYIVRRDKPLQYTTNNLLNYIKDFFSGY